MISLRTFAFALFLVSTVVVVSASEIKGAVTDTEGAAIRGARVFVHWDRSGAATGLKSNVGLKEDLVIHTNSKGEFAADVPPGFYDVFVAADAFVPDCRRVRIKPGETSVYSPKLKVDILVTNETGDAFPH